MIPVLHHGSHFPLLVSIISSIIIASMDLSGHLLDSDNLRAFHQRLKVFVDNAELFEKAKARRFDRSRLPSPSSLPTTDPGTPRIPDVLVWRPSHAVSEAPSLDENTKRSIFIKRSEPCDQFNQQVFRVHERILYQLDHKEAGRKQTLSLDSTIDILGNTENIVRSRWVDQGIWRCRWGRPWPWFSGPLDFEADSHEKGRVFGLGHTKNDHRPSRIHQMIPAAARQNSMPLSQPLVLWNNLSIRSQKNGRGSKMSFCTRG